MKKAARISRAQKYREALGTRARLEDCIVLSFALDVPAHLHFWLMLDERRPRYELFDAVGRLANVVCPKDGDNAEVIRDIARRAGATEKAVDLS